MDKEEYTDTVRKIKSLDPYLESRVRGEILAYLTHTRRSTAKLYSFLSEREKRAVRYYMLTQMRYYEK